LFEQKEVAAGVVREDEITGIEAVGLEEGVGLGDGAGVGEPDVSISHSLT
jgi:hypothetical protein